MNNSQENLNIVPSGYRILFIFYTILNESLSQKELNIKLSQNPYIEKTFTKEALIKFINTLKASDIEIIKEKSKYLITKLPWEINLSDKSLRTLEKTKEYVQSLHQTELEKDYTNFLSNIYRFLPNEKGRIKNTHYKHLHTYDKYSYLIKKIESYYKSEQKIILTTKDNETILYDNFMLEYHQKNVLLTGYCLKQNENKTIELNKIKSIKLSPQKAKGMIFPPTIMFKIKGRLALGYNLKPNEKLISQKKTELIISNKGEDKDILMRRLLKYKNLCEIISPENVKNDFKELLIKCLSNYDN